MTTMAKKKYKLERDYERLRIDGSHWVYFIQAGPLGPIKIGVARNVQYRLEQLQTANYVKLDLIAKIPCPSLKNAYYLEGNLHRLFAKKRIRGEWFRGDIDMKKALNNEKEFDELVAMQDEIGIVLEAMQRQ